MIGNYKASESLFEKEKGGTATTTIEARGKKEVRSQVSVLCLGVLTNGCLNVKRISPPSGMDCNPELSPHVHPCFP